MCSGPGTLPRVTRGRGLCEPEELRFPSSPAEGPPAHLHSSSVILDKSLQLKNLPCIPEGRRETGCHGNRVERWGGREEGWVFLCRAAWPWGRAQDCPSHPAPRRADSGEAGHWLLRDGAAGAQASPRKGSTGTAPAPSAGSPCHRARTRLPHPPRPWLRPWDRAQLGRMRPLISTWRGGPSTPIPRAQWVGSVSPSADFSLSSLSSDLPHTLGAHGTFHLGKRR